MLPWYNDATEQTKMYSNISLHFQIPQKKLIQILMHTEYIPDIAWFFFFLFSFLTGSNQYFYFTYALKTQ